jgi:hypothetical protein
MVPPPTYAEADRCGLACCTLSGHMVRSGLQSCTLTGRSSLESCTLPRPGRASDESVTHPTPGQSDDDLSSSSSSCQSECSSGWLERQQEPQKGGCLLDTVHDVVAMLSGGPRSPAPINHIRQYASEFDVTNEQLEEGLRLWSDLGVLGISEQYVEFLVPPA